MNNRNCKSIGLLVLRLAAGAIFIYHGYGKLFGDAPGMEMFTGMITGMGFPAPAFFAWCAALTEFFGGIALVLGVATPVVSSLLAVVMLVAFIVVKNSMLPAGDADLALLGIVIALIAMGPGAWSIDAKYCHTLKKLLPAKLAAYCTSKEEGCCDVKGKHGKGCC